MGIRSRVRIEYWQNRSKVPVTNTLLYPGGSDVVCQADIDASEFAAFAHSLQSAWTFANLGSSMANENFVDAGFSSENLVQSLSELKNELADRTVIKSTNLSIAYPHPLFNRIRLVFEAESTDALAEVGHAPAASSTTPIIQYESSGDRFSRCASYTIDLDKLNSRMTVSGGTFFSTLDELHPFVFEFAAKQTDGNSSTLSVLHALTLNIFRQQEVDAKAYTDILYWMRGPRGELGRVVAHQRLIKFVPRTGPGPMTRHFGDGFQFAEVPLQMENGNFVVDGKPYDFVSLNFSVVSRRKHDGLQPPIEVGADYVPMPGGIALVTHVTQPTLSPAMDHRGQPCLAEGVGTASIAFSPADISAGTMVFSAVQEPGGWTTQHDVRLYKILRPIQAEHAYGGRAGV